MTTTRKKPIYRPRNIILLLFLMVVAWFTTELYRAFSAKPGKPVDYAQKFVDLARSHQTQHLDQPNGWDHFIHATTVMESLRSTLLIELGQNPDNPTPPPDWHPDFGFPYDFDSLRNPNVPENVRVASLAALQRLRDAGAFDSLARLAASPHVVRPKFQTDGPLIGVLLPELGQARNLARANAARMYLARDNPDKSDALAALEQSLALSRTLCSQTILIDHLVGYAIAALALSELNYQLAEGRFTEQDCRQALDILNRQCALPEITLALEGERLWCLDAIQCTHTDNGRGNGRLIPTALQDFGADTGAAVPFPDHPIVNVVAIAFPSKKQTTDKANYFYDSYIRIASMPVASRHFALAQVDQEIEALPFGYVLLKQLFPALGKALSSHDQIRSQITGTQLTLAVEIHRLALGDYPQTLDVLVPSLLPELPKDPYSGKAFGYRLLPPDQRIAGIFPYVVYAAGTDGTDNQGANDPANPYKANTKEGQGLDMIINTPRPEPK